MSDSERMVIVGASLAGATAAETLRTEGWTGPIVLIGEENELPYERPPLSKGVLLGKDQPEVAQLHDRAWYDDNNVDLRLGSKVTAIDTGARRVTLADGSEVEYDKLLIATGSRVRKLDVPGADLPGINYLRTAAESKALTDAYAAKPRVVVVGAGWIGLEAASAARERGSEVTVIEPQSTALASVMGEQVGELYADLHRQHGVDLRFGVGVESFEGEDHVTGVRTSTGDVLPADLVVVGVGVQPNTELAEAAGIKVASREDGSGIVTGPDLRTSVPEVYAAGDVVRWDHPLLGHSIRVEHWQNAKDSGKTAAKAMLGQKVAQDALPYFFTDQYDLGMEYAGDVPRGTSYHVVLRGDPASGAYLAFWLDDDNHVLAGMHVNTWGSLDAVQDLIRSKKQVDPARLADSSVELSEV
ncbi:3-phenylpropionate/trans-cinnamate dioxygenase ferredoxin reductase subunit [Kribbella orskensis]|uniref:3-phenylpropionate/trans-cinnamate dioxygenase ferredoxin reductase subunit n=1 Tax=Kribbella orskensis TaxID=2512216 RepID=A0ABY2B8V5_9ACTN|nr:MULTISPECIES: FAD-dependent oxidoreductase [Kribbella]TCN32108.1 3-phenylpropionate/trans-cinnamate dioxygenase ferredoxin reductase subunit [Kribbella sp. VKM Ac-2500]TCO12127.1 3-phenylpropionate/trans-cinnamate dioxygenase ferredoxin reductase subunit [Kribbella orskensis]